MNLQFTLLTLIVLFIAYGVNCEINEFKVLHPNNITMDTFSPLSTFHEAEPALVIFLGKCSHCVEAIEFLDQLYKQESYNLSRYQINCISHPQLCTFPHIGKVNVPRVSIFYPRMDADQFLETETFPLHHLSKINLDINEKTFKDSLQKAISIGNNSFVLIPVSDNWDEYRQQYGDIHLILSTDENELEHMYKQLENSLDRPVAFIHMTKEFTEKYNLKSDQTYYWPAWYGEHKDESHVFIPVEGNSVGERAQFIVDHEDPLFSHLSPRSFQKSHKFIVTLFVQSMEHLLPYSSLFKELGREYEERIQFTYSTSIPRMNAVAGAESPDIPSLMAFTPRGQVYLYNGELLSKTLIDEWCKKLLKNKVQQHYKTGPTAPNFSEQKQLIKEATRKLVQTDILENHSHETLLFVWAPWARVSNLIRESFEKVAKFFADSKELYFAECNLAENDLDELVETGMVPFVAFYAKKRQRSIII